MGKERLRVCVTQPKYLSQIQFRHIPQQGHFIIEPGSPVLEFDRSYFDGHRIRKGRMYFYTGPDFDPDFMSWGDRVLRAVRKALVRKPELGGEYFGPATLEWIATHKATVHPGLAVFAQST